ncbi:glycosyl hydrolase 115 family protein [Amycolatopsis vastitatis]|uniref:Glycosyl hydrolase n=1 Tax=Amycolatopsis vastitatis TaxID=1905142 RepID=A0A229SLF0_9PSEU|nr:glycosyl hydrolase 115 family protein [Amycolatopsis vastitatis]OXM59785.1 glycosyl hydrolase [Amycolatopsis vastitatis]
MRHPVRGLAGAVLAVVVAAATAGFAVGGPLAAVAAPADGRLGDYLSTQPDPGSFPLVAAGQAAPLVVDAADYPGVVRAVGDLQADIGRVTGATPKVSAGAVPAGARQVVLVGTIGHSALIDGLVAAGKLDVGGIAGKWETSLEQVVSQPMSGVDSAFVIAGSDQRGTIYGAYDVSRAMGVSPWNWWDDVPARRHDALYALPARHTQGTPAVKYRGFFVNDENPQTGTWAPNVFGKGMAPGYPSGLNHRYYEKVFELALRLKANYVWPAVWGRAFAEDDPDNQATATRYGIVMGTSHEAPMTCGIEEWNRHVAKNAAGDPVGDPYGGNGQWSYRQNQAAVEAYWTKCFTRMFREKSDMVLTLGMRGNGDTALPDGSGIDLMKSIIAKQRQIIAQVTGRDPRTVPQVWTLYKEVQRYWDEGLRVPDDVTVVFTDDNWGNIREFPDRTQPPRNGGYGLYYHFDYVGASRNYKWVDTVNLADTWEQLHAAASYGDDRLWVTNVGDLKNEERPLQFFLDYAWNPDAIPASGLGDWERGFAAQNFGPDAAAGVAGVVHQYGQLQAIRKPESTNRRFTRNANGSITTDDTMTPFSIENYDELARVTDAWQRLAQQAQQVGQRLPAADQDAYYELVLYEVKATANLYALRQAQFLNHQYATQGRAATNAYADAAQARLADDTAMSNYYNTTLAKGKWKGWQTQTKIGYGDKARYGNNASWSDPPQPDQIYPALQRITVPRPAEMGVAVAGSTGWWPNATSPAALPTLTPYQTAPAPYVEVFNRGTTTFPYRITASVPWLTVTPASGTVSDQVRATVSADWSRAPHGTTRVPLTITGAGRTVTVQAVVDNPALPAAAGFVEAGGYVSMQGDHYTTAVGANGVSWLRIPDIGRDGSGMEATPVTAAGRTPGGTGPRLEYRMSLTTTGPVTVWTYLAPRNAVLPGGTGMRYAVSVDDQPPQTVDAVAATGASDLTMNASWGMNAADAANRTATRFTVSAPGAHTLKFWLVDPTVVVEKLVVDTGALATSYLGPPESLRITGAGRR